MSKPTVISEDMISSLSGPQSLKRLRTGTVYVGGPPSSPPPTSPLPKPPISPHLDSSIRSYTRSPPVRPPRPQMSLPDLRPGMPCSAGNPEKSVSGLKSGATHVPTLRSPFVSPVRSSVQRLRTMQIPPHEARSLDQYNLGVIDKRVSTNQNPARIWWSHTMTGPLMSGGITTSRPFSHPAPRIPAKSKKRQSEKPPRKAIARSALHIPSQVTLTESEAAATNGVTTIATSLLTPKIAPLMIDDFITSLPACIAPPSLQGTRVNLPVEEQLAIGKEQATNESKANSDDADASDNRRGGTRQNHISFCAVTNLEELYAPKEAVSDAHQTVNLDIAPQPEQRPWHERYRRYIWIVVTVVFVLATGGGILTGIIWKLSR